MIITFHRKTILKIATLVVVTVLACMGVSGSGAAEVFVAGGKRELPIYGVITDEKVVALTFDAAYGADKTDGIMEILKRYDVDATFFLVGFWVDKFPDKVKEIQDNGFEIGTHSNAHLNMSKLSEEEIRRDLRLSMDKISDITGQTPTVFRPPYGDYDDELVLTARDMGLYPVQWSVDSLDWKQISANEIVNRVVSRVHNGAIVLFHNNSDNILSALPTVIELLTERGYRFSSVGDLIYKDNYYIDHNGMQNKRTGN